MIKRTVVVVLMASLAALLIMNRTSYADDHERALELQKSGEILALEQILAISRQQIEGRVLEVELERERGVLIYELEILDDTGQVWELKLDATNGELIQRELED